MTRLVDRVVAGLVRRRAQLPGWLLRVIEIPAKQPDSKIGRLASRALGGRRTPPEPTEVPRASIRVYIGPTNYAGQAWQWARALERTSPDTSARNMALEIPGTFGFPADRSVPVPIQNISTAWQRAEFDAVVRFTHVLVEAERSLFGPLFSRDLTVERRELEARGVSVAYLAHGTDVRSGELHRSLTEWSPYRDGSLDERLEREADRNRRFLQNSGRPIFVSTPDLLLDVPTAAWCPLVVDPAPWLTDRAIGATQRPVVVHLPSHSGIKGSELIEPAMRALSERSTIDYLRIENVDSLAMPSHIGAADIVLDQFKLGSYGAAAVEAMAAGRVVVGHVVDAVRAHVFNATGFNLPVVEATPATIYDVVEALVADRSRMREIGAAGEQFATAVHDGRHSSAVLRSEWIDLDGPD